MASLNFFIHRLLNFPLNVQRFAKETALIKDVAMSNGYPVSLVAKIIRKRRFKETLRNSSTFQTERTSLGLLVVQVIFLKT